MDPFDKGATYRAKEAFVAIRDRFDPTERLVYFHHATSIYDGMEGWFFFVDGEPARVRSWDHGLGESPPNPFERIAEVDPLVEHAASGRAAEVSRLARDRPLDDAYVRVGMGVAVEAGHAAVVRVLAVGERLSRERLFGFLEAASSAKQLEVARALVERGTVSDRAVWSAVWSGSTDIVELLVANGADPRKMGTPIPDAIAFCGRHGHAKIAAILSRYLPRP